MKRLAILCFILAVMISCNDNAQVESASQSQVIPVTEEIVPEKKDTVKPNEKPRTDAEVIVEGVFGAIGDAVENKRKRDSTLEANKDKYFAYQIGFEKKDRGDLFETYRNLSQQGVSGLYVFKKGRKEYVLVKYEAKTETSLLEELKSFKTQIAGIEPYVEIVNMMKFCSLKELVRKDKDLTKRKEDQNIPCLICDK